MYDCGKENRCKWCGEKLFQSCPKLSPENTKTLSSCLADAISGYPYFRIWFRNNRQNINFDLSKICWQRYFDAIGWFFFVEAKRFFTVILPCQWEVVIGNMLNCHKFGYYIRDYRRKYCLPFARFEPEQNELGFFREPIFHSIMYTISIKLLERMEDCYSFTVLKRLRAKHAERLSIRLGVYLPPPPPEQDSDDEF
jgi:hypothetical protein